MHTQCRLPCFHYYTLKKKQLLTWKKQTVLAQGNKTIHGLGKICKETTCEQMWSFWKMGLVNAFNGALDYEFFELCWRFFSKLPFMLLDPVLQGCSCGKGGFAWCRFMPWSLSQCQQCDLLLHVNVQQPWDTTICDVVLDSLPTELEAGSRP